MAARTHYALRWKLASRYLKHDIPAPMRSWLFDQASLTARLTQACGTGGFRVQVLSQCRSRISSDEARILALSSSRRQALVRQVLLMCGDQAWVYARTVIPLQSLKGRQRRLSKLGSRSLGAFLFADKSLRRGEMQISRVDPARHPLFGASAWAGDTALWGRRSTFTLSAHRLLVSEFFLPALPS